MNVGFRGELVKKWGQAPRDGVILAVLGIGRRSQSPFFHKLGAKGDTKPGETLFHVDGSNDLRDTSWYAWHCRKCVKSL